MKTQTWALAAFVVSTGAVLSGEWQAPVNDPSRALLFRVHPTVGDLNGNGTPDIVAGGKSGLFLFER